MWTLTRQRAKDSFLCIGSNVGIWRDEGPRIHELLKTIFFTAVIILPPTFTNYIKMSAFKFPNWGINFIVVFFSLKNLGDVGFKRWKERFVFSNEEIEPFFFHMQGGQGLSCPVIFCQRNISCRMSVWYQLLDSIKGPDVRNVGRTASRHFLYRCVNVEWKSDDWRVEASRPIRGFLHVWLASFHLFQSICCCLYISTWFVKPRHFLVCLTFRKLGYSQLLSNELHDAILREGRPRMTRLVKRKV